MVRIAASRHAVTAQARHEVAQDIGVAEAAIAGQHHLQEHVLRRAAAGRPKPAVDQPRDGAGVLLVRRALHLLVGVEVVHADHVVLDEGAARGAGRLVVGIVEGRVHVAEHGVARIAALLLDDVEHVVPEAEPARQMDHERQARCAPGRGPRRAATSRSSAVKSDETPISPIRPMRTPSMPSSASATISSAMASIDMPASAGGCELCEVVARRP